MARPSKTYIAPAVALAPAPPPIVQTGECCGNCRGAIMVGDRLECHGQPPTAVYRGMVMGVGTYGEPLWPTVKPNLWCAQWKAKS